MIFLDTSALVDCLCGERTLLPELRRLMSRGEHLTLPTLVLYEWRRGPRTDNQIAAQQAFFPDGAAIPFTAPEALRAAQLYRSLRPARPRGADLAIAACALQHEAVLWTVNRRDFADIPGLRLL